MSVIPELPSDNMYKFKAIANFLLAIGFVVLAGWSIIYLDQPQVSEAYNNVGAWENKDQEIQTQLDLVDSLISDKDTCSSDSVKSPILLSQSSLTDWKLELFKEKHRNNMAYWDNNSALENYEFDSETNLILFVFLILIAAVFGISSSESFRDWKIHVQRYEDAILMRKAGVSEEKIKEHIVAALEETKRSDAEEKQSIFIRIWSVIRRWFKGSQKTDKPE